MLESASAITPEAISWTAFCQTASLAAISPPSSTAKAVLIPLESELFNARLASQATMPSLIWLAIHAEAIA